LCFADEPVNSNRSVTVKKPSILIIFITVLIDLVGFGLILPLIPLYTDNFGASKLFIGAIIASYSLMQFIFAPIWGRISDRIGRRPVLLGSTFCATVSYIIFAYGSSLQNHSLALWTILLSRMFAGICGANITVAQAYIADITPPEKRSARMGIIGMAFGLGFILGPAIGGTATKYFGLAAPGWVAAGLCALNFIWALVRLPESWAPNMEEHVPQRPHLAQWIHTLTTPQLNILIAVFFLATFSFTCFESTVGLLVKENFHIDTKTKEGISQIVYLIVYSGIVGALSQGFIRPLVKVMGEPKLVALSMFLAAVGIGLLPFAQTNLVLYIVLGVFAIGSSLTRPPVFGMISQLTAAHEQGTNIGVAQGVGSLARIVGPIFATGLFAGHPAVPYVACGALSVVTGCIAAAYLKKIAAPAAAPAAVVSH
jgi:MFS transporter, DHA1 family, tetracycline resistance protein